MAKKLEEINKNFDNLQDSVRKSFAHVYACLKAQELKTLRQLDVLRKQLLDDTGTKGNCIQNIEISYENESVLLENIQHYGAIDLEKLNYDTGTFMLEDYVNPSEDHMYSYKCIDDLAKELSENMEAIQIEAMRQITSTENCVCYVEINREEVARNFEKENSLHQGCSLESTNTSNISEESNIDEKYSPSEENDLGKNKSEETNGEDAIRIDPTDDWLKSIKSQTETEPSQVTDDMEQSTFACS